MKLEYAFTAILTVYVALILFRTVQPLVRLKRESENVREIPGKVAEHKGEETIAAAGEKVKTAYPVYVCQIDGQEVRQTGYIRLAVTEREAGSGVTLIYEPRSRTICCKEDIPLMKKAAVKRTMFLLILYAVVAAVGFLP